MNVFYTAHKFIDSVCIEGNLACDKTNLKKLNQY